MGKSAKTFQVAALTGLLGATILTTATALAPPAVPSPAAELGRADAYVAQVESRMAQRAQAALDAITVKVVFPPGRPLRVLLVGDAITLGSSASIEDARYRSLLAAALGSKGSVGMTVIASSKKGGAVRAGELAAQVPAGEPFDLVVVMVGTNEAAAKDVAGYSQDFPALLSAIRVGSPAAGLLCIGSWGDKNSVQEFDLLAADACSRQQGRFRPVSALFTTEKNRWAQKKLPDGRPTDNFFPSDLGHGAIAKVIESALQFPPRSYRS